MEAKKHIRFQSIFASGLARSSSIFFSAWLGPLAIIAATAWLLGGRDSLMNRDFNVYLCVFFAISAIGNTLLNWRSAEIQSAKAIILAALLVWAVTLFFDLIYFRYVMDSEKWTVSVARSFLNAVVLVAGWFVLELSAAKRVQNSLEFRESKRFYSGLIARIALLLWLSA